MKRKVIAPPRRAKGENMKFFKNKMQTGATLGALALVGCLAAGPMYAYLTDNEQTTNTFTVGKVQIDLEEPSYPGNGSDEVTNIVPNQVIEKDPQVKNTGKNSAVVFASVSIPYKNLVTANDAGAKENNGTLTPTQIFKTSTDGKDFSDTAVNNNWTLISTEYYDAYGVKQDVKAATDKTAKVVRTYGYKTKVADNDTTDPIFTNVKLANVVEGYIDSTTQDIEIKTFAIQADNITGATIDGTVVNTSNEMDDKALGAIYGVYVAQNSNASNKDAATSNKYDLGIGGTVTENTSYTTTISASIDNAKIEVGKTAKITYTMDTLDSKKNQNVSYEVADNTVVSVSEAGVVTAKSKGKTTITVKTEDDAKAIINVEVKDATSDAAPKD